MKYIKRWCQEQGTLESAKLTTTVERVTTENLKAGFILKVDADTTIRLARYSGIGRLDSAPQFRRVVPIPVEPPAGMEGLSRRQT